jgi:hypothetical protein
MPAVTLYLIAVQQHTAAGTDGVISSKFKNSKVARTAPTNFEPLNFEL